MKSVHIAALAILLPLSLQAQGQVVGQGGISQFGDPTPWTRSAQAGGNIGVTTENPCGKALSGVACADGFGGVGDGSLEMLVTGVRDPNTLEYPDWAFWYTYAGGSATSGQSYGNLADLNQLSFDWFREGTDGWDAPSPEGEEQPVNPIDWRYKTPVLRLQLRETNGDDVFYSELVWEGYYNQPKICSADGICGVSTPVDQWVRQADMQSDNFWFIRPPAMTELGEITFPGHCNEQLSFWSGGVTSADPGSLLDQCFLEGSTVEVIGVAVGVGSQWPLPYHGFVDNVRIGFAGQPDLALDANFDFIDLPPDTKVSLTSTVPEPSTYALMGAGLLALGFAARRRRNKA